MNTNATVNPQTSEEQPKAKQSSDTSKESQKKKEQPKEEPCNAVLVLNGTREVRRYTPALNGKNFVELAEEFASTRGYTTKKVNLEPQTKCPSCGHMFDA